jgi:hypothetical protein
MILDNGNPLINMALAYGNSKWNCFTINVNINPGYLFAPGLLIIGGKGCQFSTIFPVWDQANLHQPGLMSRVLTLMITENSKWLMAHGS